MSCMALALTPEQAGPRVRGYSPLGQLHQPATYSPSPVILNVPRKISRKNFKILGFLFQTSKSLANWTHLCSLRLKGSAVSDFIKAQPMSVRECKEKAQPGHRAADLVLAMVVRSPFYSDSVNLACVFAQ